MKCRWKGQKVDLHITGMVTLKSPKKMFSVKRRSDVLPEELELLHVIKLFKPLSSVMMEHIAVSFLVAELLLTFY